MDLLYLTADYPELSSAEINALLPKATVRERLAFIPSYTSNVYRIATARSYYKMLFSCPLSKLDRKISSYNWQRIYKRSFSLNVFLNNKRSNGKEGRLAAIIHSKLKSPKVNINNAKTKITVFIQGKTAYCCLELDYPKQDFLKRRPHLRPGFSPISLHPKLARILVNLTGSSSSIHDPMCGTGGFLIEAGLMGLKVSGNDLSTASVAATKKILAHYKIKGIVTNQDATKTKKKHSYIITDLPYGRNTSLKNDLYSSFLNSLDKTLTKRAVIVFPHTYNFKKELKKTSLSIVASFSHYIHRSLSKSIIVLQK